MYYTKEGLLARFSTCWDNLIRSCAGIEDYPIICTFEKVWKKRSGMRFQILCRVKVPIHIQAYFWEIERLESQKVFWLPGVRVDTKIKTLELLIEKWVEEAFKELAWRVPGLMAKSSEFIYSPDWHLCVLADEEDG